MDFDPFDLDSVPDILAFVLGAAVLVGIAYQIVATRLVWRFARTPAPRPAARPPITILKPLHGDELGLAENLSALCRQGYPDYQIVCGTLAQSDPAQRVAAEVRDAHPAVDMMLVAGGGNLAHNRKVANLEQMLTHARHDVIALADSDVRVGPNHLDDLAAALEQPRAGLATCLYLARPDKSLWSRLESLWINHTFLPAALVARAVGRRDGCFGATIALRRDVLERAGGLAPLRDVLADDWALGAAVRKLGLEIALVARPVDMVVDHRGFKSWLGHELRWGRTIAALDRVGYSASVVTQPVILSVLAALAGSLNWRFLAAATGALVVRLVAVRVQERALFLAHAPWSLLVLREFLTFAVFVGALMGRTVRWRGLRYRILADGTMQPLEDLPR